MALVRIQKNSLSSMLRGNSSTGKENQCNKKENRSRNKGTRRAPSYRRFNAAHMSGITDPAELARVAAQTLQEGEVHFGSSLSRLRGRSIAGKKRSQMRQHQFAWMEEHRAMSAEAKLLEKDVVDAVEKVAAAGLSSPMDELKLSNAKFNNEYKVSMSSQLKSIRELVDNVVEQFALNAAGGDATLNGGPSNNERESREENSNSVDLPGSYYETASILSEVFDAHKMVAIALKKELEECQSEFHLARLAVFQTMRETADNSEASNGNDSESGLIIKSRGRTRRLPETNIAMWSRLSQIASRAILEVTDQDLANVPDQDKEQILCSRIGDSLLYDMYENAVALLADHKSREKAIRFQIRTLQDEHQTKEESAQDPEGGSDSTGPVHNATTGGWRHKDHLLFAKAWRECVDRGKGHGEFRKRLSVLLPHMSRDDITTHAHWFERQRFLNRQVKEEHARWERSIADLLRRSGEEFRAAVKENVEQEKLQAEWMRTKDTQSALHKKLSKMRIAFEKQRSEREAQERERARALEAAMQKERLADAARREREKEEIEEYRDEKRAAAQREAERRCAEEEAAEKKRLQDAPMHAERVKHRKEVFEQRQIAQRELLAKKEREKSVALEALERLKKQCAYFEKIKNIAEHQDPNHHIQVTRAYDAAVKELASLRAAHAGLLSDHDRGPGRGLNGFDSKRVVGDIRFKLVEQLREAGLQSTPYAQAMIISMSNRLRPQPAMKVSASAPWGSGPKIVMTQARSFGSGF